MPLLHRHRHRHRQYPPYSTCPLWCHKLIKLSPQSPTHRPLWRHTYLLSPRRYSRSSLWLRSKIRLLKNRSNQPLSLTHRFLFNHSILRVSHLKLISPRGMTPRLSGISRLRASSSNQSLCQPRQSPLQKRLGMYPLPPRPQSRCSSRTYLRRSDLCYRSVGLNSKYFFHK